MPELKRNIAGYYDEFGRFRPIRSPQFVGSQRRKATPKDRKKYSRSKAGDNGIAAQEKATGVEFFDRLNRKEKAYKDHVEKQIRREWLGSNDEMGEGRSLVEFVRDSGGIRPTYKFGGKKNRGKRVSYDAGDLAALTYKESGKRGLVSDKGKYSLDDMYKQATAAGYAVQGAWDLIDLMQKEIATGEKTYANHGWLDYRDNPAGKSDLHIQQLGSRSFGVFLKTYLLKKFTTRAAAESHLRSIRSRAKGNPAGSDADAYTLTIYDRNNRVKSVNVIDARTGKAIAKYKSLAGAKRFASQKGIRLEVNPASAVRLAKAAISVFDNDLDLDVDSKDLARLKRGQKAIAKNPSVASVILEQLGGNKFLAMTGAKNLGTNGRDLFFRLPARFANDGITYVKISLTPADLYDVEYGKIVKYQTKVLHVSKGIFADQLRADFTKVTGLDTSLGNMKGNPIDPLGMFANAAVGIASALQIKEYLNQPERKPAAKRKTRGTTKAKSNPAGVRGGQRVADREFYRDLSAIEDGNVRKVRAAKLHGVNAGYTKKEIEWLVNRAKLAARYKAKLNPADYKTEMRKALKNPASLATLNKQIKAIEKRIAENDFTTKKARDWANVALELAKFQKRELLEKRRKPAKNPKAIKWVKETSKSGEVYYSGLINGNYPPALTVDRASDGRWFGMIVRTGSFTEHYRTPQQAMKAVELLNSKRKSNPRVRVGKKAVIQSKKANPAGRVGPWQRIESNVWVRFNADGRTVAQIRKISASDFRVWAISGKKGGNENIHSIAAGSLTDAKSQAAKIMSKAGPSKAALDWGGVVRQANPTGRVGKKAVAGSRKANPERCLKCRKMTPEGVFDMNGGFCNKCDKKRTPSFAGRVGKKAAAGSRKGSPSKRKTPRVGDTVLIDTFDGQSWFVLERIYTKGGVKQIQARPLNNAKMHLLIRYDRIVAFRPKGSPPVSVKPKSNPKPPRSRTFEMFQGRPVTTAKRMPISKHAPARVAQLGDLIELRLVGGKVIKPNPKKFKLCAANGKLWIVGGKFAKPNPKAAANEINPIAEISHVVYGTRKPHHGDNAYTHYIHKLGEESGKRPLLTVDREGYPVIRGGNYKIEARGIVD